MLRFTLIVSNTIAGLDGQPLDQIPSEAGAQSYVTDFAMPCTPPSDAPEPPRCGEPVVAPQKPFCPGAPRFVCIDDFCQTNTDGSGMPQRRM